jgi:methyl-accepting chemotaxis protein
MSLLCLGGFLYHSNLSTDDVALERDVAVLGRAFKTLLEEAGPDGDFSEVIGRFRNNFIGCLDIEELFVLLPGLPVQPSKPSSSLARLLEEAAAFPSEMKKTDLINGKWISVQRLRPSGFGHVVLLLVLSDRGGAGKTDWHNLLFFSGFILFLHIVVVFYIVERLVLARADKLAGSIDVAMRIDRGVSDAISSGFGYEETCPLERVDSSVIAFLSRIRTVIDELSDAVRAMAATCSEIDLLSKAASSSVLLSERSVDETKSSLDEIKKIVDVSQKRVRDVVLIAGKTDKTASMGHSEIARVIESMKSVAKSLSTIHHISLLVGEVADSANNLALTSAIEAARANDPRSGIALVAEEVKNLSAGLRDVSKQIDEVALASSSILSDSARLADSAGDKLENIVSGVGDTAQLIGQISDDVNLWFSLINNVLRDVTEVDRAVKENALAVSGSKKVAEKLLGKTVAVNQALNELSLRTGK